MLEEEIVRILNTLPSWMWAYGLLWFLVKSSVNIHRESKKEAKDELS